MTATNPKYTTVQSAAQLTRMLYQSDLPYVLLPGDCGGLLQSVEREDGSGLSFNVTVTNNGVRHTHYVRFAH